MFAYKELATPPSCTWTNKVRPANTVRYWLYRIIVFFHNPVNVLYHIGFFIPWAGGGTQIYNLAPFFCFLRKLGNYIKVCCAEVSSVSQTLINATQPSWFFEINISVSSVSYTIISICLLYTISVGGNKAEQRLSQRENGVPPLIFCGEPGGLYCLIICLGISARQQDLQLNFRNFRSITRPRFL